ncbi:helix-turn-helix transcriptional regulator [Enterococcus sp. AZ163]|uniref:helix-turn-helix transcriptional regulator n=1 Tax=Enterococcus sp. AZ163 TaxID=2774638 RepID=UPI003D2D5DA4
MTSTLKDLRRLTGMTQNEMAKKINVSRKTVSAWELGMRSPRIATAKRIGKIFCIDWKMIYEESEEEK